MGNEPAPLPARSDPPQRSWMRFLDAATAIAVASGILYGYGWLYQAGFYRSFGLSVRAVGATTPDVLLTSWTAVAVILLAIPCWLLARLAERASGGELRAWAHNGAVLLYLLAVAGFWWLTAPRAAPALAGTLLLLAAAAGLVALSRRRLSAPEVLLGGDRAATPALRFAVALAFLALLGVLANAQGRSAARELVADRAGYRPQVVLLMKDEASWFHGRAFFLILQQDGLYYLTPLEQGDRDAPLLFVLQQGDVEVAVLSRDTDAPLDGILDQIAPATPAAP